TTAFDLPGVQNSPFGITTGPDGNLWFDETFPPRVGKMTTSGAITEYPMSESISSFGQIVVGPDNNLWMIAGPGLVRMTLQGETKTYPIWGAGLSRLVGAPDGRMWFAAGGVNGGNLGFVQP